MGFLKSRKQLNNHIIWLAKYRRTLLFFFQGIKANIHVILWDMTVAWAAVAGKSFYSAAWTLYTFCPPCEIHHLVGIHFNSACARAMRTWESLKKEHWRHCNPTWPHPVNVCSCFKAAGSHTRSVGVFHLLLLSDTLSVLTNGNEEPHHTETNHIGAPKSCPVEKNCLGFLPARNIRLTQIWPSSQIFLNPYPLCHKGSRHSLKCKCGPLLVFSLLLLHLGARHNLRL